MGTTTAIPAMLLLWLLSGSAHAQTRPSALPPPPAAGAGPSDYLDLRPSGGYRFGYSTGDLGQHHHTVAASADGRVQGRYGERGRHTEYTAGPRGFRARGSHIARRPDLSQTLIPYNPPVRQDSSAYRPSYSGYHDPNEDPSYDFGFRTPGHSRHEAANSNGDVKGQYSYVDDVGERHTVEYIAGSRTGFHVKTPYPDSVRFDGSLFVGTPGKPGQKLRGRSSIQRGLDGSYRFTAAGPDQRRTEVADANGNVRGSYTYLDDKGVQRTTEYIAGPNIGYKVINSKKGPLSSIYPYVPSGFLSPLPDYDEDDLFGKPADGFQRPGGKPPGGGKPSKIDDDLFGSSPGLYNKPNVFGGFSKPESDSGSLSSGSSEDEDGDGFFAKPGGAYGKPTPGGAKKPTVTPPRDHFSTEEEDLFGATPPGFHEGGSSSEQSGGSSGGGDFFSGGGDADSGSGGSYGNCCPAPHPLQRGTARYRKPGASHQSSGPYSHVRDFSYNHPGEEQALVSHHGTGDGYVGTPSGVAVRAHVQSLDVLPFGHRIPTPGAALEQLTNAKRRSSDARRS